MSPGRLLASCLIATLGLPIFQAIAEKPQWKAGMEIELAGEQVLSAAFRYMEFSDEDEIRQRINPLLTNELLNSALSPEVFDKLPTDLKNQLSNGLSLGRPHIESQTTPKLLQPNSQAPTAIGFLGADGRPIDARPTKPSLILPTGISVSSSAPPNLTKNEAGIIVPKGIQDLPPTEISAKNAWETVQRRWKELSRDLKLKAVSPNDLPKEVLAVLYKQRSIEPSDFRPRSDLPAPVLDLFSRLEWERDTYGPLEFRHKVPLDDPMAVKKDIETFSKMVGIHKYISDPTHIEPDVRGFSFHVHISNPNADAKMLGEYINRIRMLELYEQGRSQAALNSQLSMGYSLFVQNKGLIRVIGKDRIESRIHTVGYSEEIDRLTKYLSLPETQAVKELDDLFTKKMANLLSDISKLKPGSKERLAALQAALAINPVQTFPEEMSSDIARAISILPANAGENLALSVAKQRYNPKYPHTVWESEIAAIKASGSNGESFATSSLLAQYAKRLEGTKLLLDHLPCGKMFERLSNSN